MSKLGPGRMPRIGSNEIDEAGVKLIHDWIAQLPGTGLVGDAAGRESAKARAAVERLRTRANASQDELQKPIDEILAAPSTALRLTHALGDQNFPLSVREAVMARAAKWEVPETRDLFEKFLPEEKRIKRLGDVIRPEQILSLAGDPERGRKLFFDVSGVQCKNCHRIGGKGTEVGPDLDQIGKKYGRAEILENILNPSKQIEAKYLTYAVTTTKGQVHTGLLVSKDTVKVVLKDATNKLIEVPAGDVDAMVAQQKSLMPDLLLRDFTAEQVADLTAFLSSLK
jgi:putative heme-binding domain-containing protein